MMHQQEEDPARAAKRKLIEERVRLAREQQAQQEQQKVATGKALTREEIIAKMNAVPVFVVLDRDLAAVSIKDESTGIDTIFWHTEPLGAKAHLDEVTKQHPGVPGLHIGAMSLGLAFPLYAGWEGAVGVSTRCGGAADAGSAPARKPRHSIVAEAVAGIDLPVYVCGELQNEKVLPVFFNRRDLAQAWVQSGRPAKSFSNEKLMVVELPKFVEDMQTPVYSLWNTVRFITSGAAVAVVTGQSAANKQASCGEDKQQGTATAQVESAS